MNRKILNLYGQMITILNKSQSLVLLIIRLLVAHIFFLSGLTKISNWEQTLFLFEYEYAVPFFPVNVAAFLATSFELTMPVLLIAGLFTRLAALPLFAMTLVIQFFVYQEFNHYYWMIMLATLMTYGGGKLSIDYFLAKKFGFKA